MFRIKIRTRASTKIIKKTSKMMRSNIFMTTSFFPWIEFSRKGRLSSCKTLLVVFVLDFLTIYYPYRVSIWQLFSNDKSFKEQHFNTKKDAELQNNSKCFYLSNCRKSKLHFWFSPILLFTFLLFSLFTILLFTIFAILLVLFTLLMFTVLTEIDSIIQLYNLLITSFVWEDLQV